MRVQFDKFYRGILLVLGVLLVWSVWNLAAQDTGSPTTNSVTASLSVTSGGTNSTTTATVDASASKPMATPAWIDHLAENVPFLQSSSFSEDDLIDLPSLANKLKQTTDPVSAYLKSQLSSKTLTALANYQGSNSDTKPLQTALASDLNRVIGSQSLYDVQRFSGVTLRPKTQQLLEKSPKGSALKRLNSLLLADAYPLEISKSSFLKWMLWDNELWKYLFSLAYIFLAFYVSKLLDYLTRVWLKRWAEKTETKFDDLILELLNGPIKVVAFMIFLRIGLDVFAWPATVQKFLSKGFTIIVAISLTYMVMKFIDLLLNFWRQRAAAKDDEAFNKQLFPIIRKSLKIFVVVVATLVTLDNLDVNITAAIASLSIGGLAVGLAAQDTLANLFGAIAIFLDKPFKIGDRIQVDNVDGPVESIGLRSTRVRNLDGHLVSIPNKTMGNSTIVNVAARERIKTVMNLGITYDTPVEKVKLALSIIKEVYGQHPMTSELITSFNKFESSALNILVVHFWKDADFVASLGGLQEMNLTLKERFDREGINFAFPTQTLYVKQDSRWQLTPGDPAPPVT